MTTKKRSRCVTRR